MTGAEHRRACVQCRGEGWVTGPDVNGWPTLNACSECRPVVAARIANGAYRADAPIIEATDAELMKAESVPRTALWPWPQMLTEWPAPGPRTTFPNPTRKAPPA